MPLSLNPDITDALDPPIAEAHGWIAGRTFPPEKPLIDLAQAVPGYPPARPLQEHLAELVKRPESGRYTEITGLPQLRRALAAHLSQAYDAEISSSETAITAGCNQAFCLAVMALARAGDEIVLPLPYYFNHRMWLDMLGIRAVSPTFEPDGVSPETLAAAIGPKTKAIVLVSPSNPSGVILPPERIDALMAVARAHDVPVILDETYKDFLPSEGPPHRLFQDPAWRDGLIQLLSFSKCFAIPGYRVGALVAGPKMIAATTKIMDTIAICAPRIGQEAALYGLTHLGDWLAEKRRTTLDRLAAFQAAMAARGNSFRVVTAGAYFALVAHPFEDPSPEKAARRLATEANLLTLPGSFFGLEGEPLLRFAFANVDVDLMPVVAERLKAAA